MSSARTPAACFGSRAAIERWWIIASSRSLPSTDSTNAMASSPQGRLIQLAVLAVGLRCLSERYTFDVQAIRNDRRRIDRPHRVSASAIRLAMRARITCGMVSVAAVPRTKGVRPSERTILNSARRRFVLINHRILARTIIGPRSSPCSVIDGFFGGSNTALDHGAWLGRPRESASRIIIRLVWRAVAARSPPSRRLLPNYGTFLD